MTIDELKIILTGAPSDIISKFQVTSFPNLPKWTDLEKEYDPLQHKIFDTTVYPPKLNEYGIDDIKRTAFGLQKLAVNRVAQSMFVIPVTRAYNFDTESDTQNTAVQILEHLYVISNKIDSSNLERAKMLLATCQMCTIWSVSEKLTKVGENISNYRLKHTNYCQKDGYTLYPIVDGDNDLLVMSIAYTDVNQKDHFISYINIPNDCRAYHFINDSGWQLIEGFPKKLTFFPVLYMNSYEPAWGGNENTILVERMEEMESFRGFYIRKNSLPTFTLDYGDITGAVRVSTDEKSDDSRRIIVTGKGGQMNDVTWKGADESIQNSFEILRNSFFEQNQIPDTSFANMIKSNTSAENKELVFSDSKGKALDLSGEWISMFYDEFEIVKQFAAILFPKFAKDFETISCIITINPYVIRSKQEAANYVSTASSSMSLATRVKVLGEVFDVQKEVEQIENEQSANANQLF